MFSPKREWLLLMSTTYVHGKPFEVDVWHLPDVRSAGSFVTTSRYPRLQFTPDETRLAVLPTFGSSSKGIGYVLDLESASRLCDFETFDFPVELESWFVSNRVFVGVWQEGSGFSPSRVSSWSLASGKTVSLSELRWKNNARGLFSPDGTRFFLYGGLHDEEHFAAPSLSVFQVELWDILKGKLLQEWSKKGAGYGNPVADTEKVGWPVGEAGKSDAFTCWKWSDGSGCSFTERSIVARASPATAAPGSAPSPETGLDWVLWKGDEGLLLQKGVSTERILLEGTGDYVFHVNGMLSPDGSRFALLRPHGVSKEAPSPCGAQVGPRQDLEGLWDAKTGRCVTSFSDSQLTSLKGGRRFSTFDSSGRWYAAWSSDGTAVSVWDAEKGERVHRLQLPSQISECMLGPDGTRMVVISKGSLQLWDMTANRRVMTIEKPGHLLTLSCVAQHRDANLVASAGDDGEVILWNREDGTLKTIFQGYPGRLSAIAFHPNGKRLGLVAADGTITLLDLELDGQWIWTSRDKHSGSHFRCLAFCPEASRMIGGTEDGRVVFFEPETGKVLASSQVDSAAVCSIATSSNGELLLAGTASGHVQVFDPKQSTPQRFWKASCPVNALAFLGQEFVVTGGKRIEFWAVDTAKQVMELPDSFGACQTLAYDDGSKQLVLADEGHRVTLLDLRNLQAALEELHLGIPGFPADMPRTDNHEAAKRRHERK
jgi:WD40 repeat protein